MDFPGFNASLNGLAAVLILLGWIAVRFRRLEAHKGLMLAALLVSSVFLASYLYYHFAVLKGQRTVFSERHPSAAAWVGTVYYVILISHMILAVIIVPMALITAYLGLRNRLDRHRRLGRWTMPLWLYVSVTGVVV